MGVLDRVLFVVWGFPEPTQTFILRELSEMHFQGERVSILASHRVDHPGAPQEVVDMANRAIYLGPGPVWALRGLTYGLVHPRRLLDALLWMGTLPHRTLWHRLRALGLVLAAASVAGRVKTAGFQYLHAHFAHHAELAMALSRLIDVPWGATFHAVGIWRERNLLREKVDQARVVMTCTAHNRQELLRHAQQRMEHVHLVYHGLEDRVFAMQTQPASSSRTYLAVGRLVEKKGLAVLLRAWGSLPEPRPSLRIVGDGPLRKPLEQLTRELHIQEAVTFTGALRNHEVLAEMASARCLVQPSVVTKRGDVDGIPNVILEAMALGRPIIASELSGIPEVVVPEITGLLVRPGNESSLGDAIERLSKDDALCQTMGENARTRVEQDFSIARAVLQQLDLLKRASAPDREPGRGNRE